VGHAGEGMWGVCGVWGMGGIKGACVPGGPDSERIRFHVAHRGVSGRPADGAWAHGAPRAHGACEGCDGAPGAQGA
jgi:hypothetical protein